MKYPIVNPWPQWWEHSLSCCYYENQSKRNRKCCNFKQKNSYIMFSSTIWGHQWPEPDEGNTRASNCGDNVNFNYCLFLLCYGHMGWVSIVEKYKKSIHHLYKVVNSQQTWHGCIQKSYMYLKPNAFLTIFTFIQILLLQP